MADPAATLVACIDGSLIEPAQATIPVTDDGLLRGDGVFEVIRVYGGRPFGLDAHLDRLEASAGAIDLGVDRAALESDAATALGAAGPRDAALRIVWTRGGHRVLLVEELPAYPGPAALASIGHETNPILEGVKSLSYAANMQATRMARSLGADEALFVRPDGTILEAPTAAIFWVSEGRLRTPALDGGILASITRRTIVAALEVEEGSYKLFDLQGADEAFLASTTREVQPVSALDGTPLPLIDGKWTERAAEVIKAAVEAALGS
jgi:branched-chain amino acid aminotransferase